MRLFEDGRFEYDDFPDYDLPRTRNVVITRKEPHLAKADVDKLVALAETDDFLTADARYESLRPYGDAWIATISFRHGGIKKSITVVSFWDTQYNSELKKHYPNSLVELLEQVEVMQGKAIGKASYQWLAKPSNNK